MINLQPLDLPSKWFNNYALEGLDSNQFCISNVKDDPKSWYLGAKDDRGIWFRVGDREDLKPEWLGAIPSYWNGNFEWSTRSFATHEEWLQVMLDAKNSSEAR